MQPLRDEHGAIAGFRVLQLDLTGRKRLQDERARAEVQFRFVFESVPVGLSWARRAWRSRAHDCHPGRRSSRGGAC